MRILSVSATLAMLIAMLAAAFVAGGGSAHAASYTGSSGPASASRGQLQAVGTVTPANLAVNAAATHQLASMPLRRPSRGNASHATSMLAPQAAATKVSGAGTVLHNFNGVDAIQSQSAQSNGVDVEPPDEGLGAGNGYVFNLVNLAGIIYRYNGTIVAGPFSLSTFFNEPPAFSTVLISDPRVYYDPSTNRWFATELEFNLKTGKESHLDIAVSTSGNPAGSYRLYRIDTTDPTGYECPCFSDYPILGIDQYNLYISGNEFSISGTAFNGAEIFAISKSQLETGAKKPNYVRFGSLSIGGALAYHAEAAITYGNAPAEYFMASLDPNSTFDNRLGVWALTNQQSVTTGKGMPQLTSTVITSETYGFPPNAVTPPGYCSNCGAPTTGIVQTDFDAMEEVQYINGHLDGALNTAVTIPGDTTERAGIAWFQVIPVLSGNAISSRTHVSHQGYLAAQGLYLMYPHINETPNGNMAMVFGLGGPATYLSAAYSVKPARSANFGAISVYGAGVAPDNGFTGTAAYGGAGRWGDYSNGEIIPGTNQVWLATQYIPNNGDGYANWGNRIVGLQL
jgi:hypothetical protein